MSTINPDVNGSTVRLNTINFRFVRAAETDFDEQGRVCGSLDLPLGASGRKRLDALARDHTSSNVVMVYSATCSAAKETAKAIAEPHRCKVRTIDSWANLDHGLWHGKCIDDIKHSAPRFYRQWQDTPEKVAPPQGETFDEVKRRCKVSVERIRNRRFSSGDVLVVAPEPLLQILFELFDQ